MTTTPVVAYVTTAWRQKMKKGTTMVFSKPMIYLAAPYASQDKHLTGMRKQAVDALTANLVHRGVHVFSPLTYSTYIHALGAEPPSDFIGQSGWYDFDLEFLSRCDAMVVACMPGWEESYGVKVEMARAKELGMRIYTTREVNPNDVPPPWKRGVYAYQEIASEIVAWMGDPATELTMDFAPPNRRRIFRAINQERDRQDAKHGREHQYRPWLHILAEELGELAEGMEWDQPTLSHQSAEAALLRLLQGVGAMARQNLESGLADEGLGRIDADELTQLAAVAIAWQEAFQQD